MRWPSAKVKLSSQPVVVQLSSSHKISNQAARTLCVAVGLFQIDSDGNISRYERPKVLWKRLVHGINPARGTVIILMPRLRLLSLTSATSSNNLLRRIHYLRLI